MLNFKYLIMFKQNLFTSRECAHPYTRKCKIGKGYGTSFAKVTFLQEFNKIFSGKNRLKILPRRFLPASATSTFPLPAIKHQENRAKPPV
jgi:hypothetical protein